MPPDTNFLKSAQRQPTPAEKKNQKKGMRSFFRRKELGVNLMSGEVVAEASKQIEKKNLIQIGVSFLIACGLVGLTYLGIFLYGYFNEKSLQSVEDRLTATNQEIAALEQNAPVLAVFQNTLGSLSTLLSGHIYWTRFLEKLESVTLKDVQYDSLSVSANSNSLTLNGIARNYTDIGKQVRAFQTASSTFPSVSVTTANAIIDQGGQVTGVNFTLSLTTNLDFIKGSENATSSQQ